MILGLVHFPRHRDRPRRTITAHAGIFVDQNDATDYVAGAGGAGGDAGHVVAVRAGFPEVCRLSELRDVVHRFGLDLKAVDTVQERCRHVMARAPLVG
jgi:hypothetical protein